MEANNAERVVTTVHKPRDAVCLARTKPPVRQKKGPYGANLLLSYIGKPDGSTNVPSDVAI